LLTMRRRAKQGSPSASKARSLSALLGACYPLSNSGRRKKAGFSLSQGLARASQRRRARVHHSRAEQFREELVPEEISADRVSAVAIAARVPLAPIDAERIAPPGAPHVARVAGAKIDLSLEPEPASFLAVQRREIAR